MAIFKEPVWSAERRTRNSMVIIVIMVYFWRNMAPNSNAVSKFVLLKSVQYRGRQRRRKIESVLHFLKIRRQQLLKASFLIALLILSRRNAAVPIRRSCRRLGRNQGWWRNVWETYSDARFKKTFRVLRKTFSFILERIHPALERKTYAEDPIEPAFRPAICLYRLARGTYYHTLSELCGVGFSTVATITREVYRKPLSKSCGKIG